jgi:DNA-binding HxlR family transcriptional regulator
MIGRRWTGAILRSLMAGSVRFTEIRETIPDLSDRLLAERLRELELEEVVERRVLTPRHIEYHLTAKGQALAPVVDAASDWAEHWLADTAPPSGPAGRARPKTRKTQSTGTRRAP